MWSLLYIALEIDQPFGEDDNDLPMRAIQHDFNQSLLALLDPMVQTPPTFVRTRKPLKLVRSNTLNFDKVNLHAVHVFSDEEDTEADMITWNGVGDRQGKQCSLPGAVEHGEDGG